MAKENLLNLISNKDVLHFSCPASFDPTSPLKSGLVLYELEEGDEVYPEDMLSALDILTTALKADLVTLSSTEIIPDAEAQGADLIGLTYPFLYAGAASEIISLWWADVESTEELMLDFYRNLLQGKRDKVDVLRQAQLDIMRKKEYEHPFHWAPFILIGNYR